MSEKQKKLLKEIISYIDKNGFSPSIRELTRLKGFKSTSTVHMYLNQLELEGYIEREKFCQRAMAVTQKGMMSIN